MSANHGAPATSRTAAPHGTITRMNPRTESLLLRAFAIEFCQAPVRNTDTPVGARQVIERQAHTEAQR